MKKKVKIYLSVALVVALAVTIYFSFIFQYTCDSSACFREHQIKCTRTVFVSDGDEVVWQYRILEKEKGNCLVEAKILQIKAGTLDKQTLEKKAMICSVPLGDGRAPESDLKECHGLLKEEIQEIMIKNAHAQILANIGEIDDALDDIV
jgi:hypothetical protein